FRSVTGGVGVLVLVIGVVAPSGVGGEVTAVQADGLLRGTGVSPQQHQTQGACQEQCPCSRAGDEEGPSEPTGVCGGLLGGRGRGWGSDSGGRRAGCVLWWWVQGGRPGRRDGAVEFGVVWLWLGS